MNDNTIFLVSDYVNDTSYAMGMKVSPDSHQSPLSHERTIIMIQKGLMGSPLMKELHHSTLFTPFYQMRQRGKSYWGPRAPFFFDWGGNIQTIKRMREHIYVFIKLYMRTNNRDHNNAKVRTQLELQSRLNVISWITPGEHSKADYMAWRGVTLLESVDAVKYIGVDVEMLGTS